MELFNHYLLTKEATKLLFENDTVPTSAFQWITKHLCRIKVATMTEILQTYHMFAHLRSILLSTIVLARHEYTTEVEQNLLKLPQQFKNNKQNFQIYLVDEKNKAKIYQELFEPDVNLTSAWLMYLQGFEPDDNYFLSNTQDLKDFWYDYGLALERWFSNPENVKCTDGLLGIRPKVTIDIEHIDEDKMSIKDNLIYLPMKNLPFCFFEIDQTGEIYRQGGLLVKENVKFSENLKKRLENQCQILSKIPNNQQENLPIKNINDTLPKTTKKIRTNTLINTMKNLLSKLSNIIILPLTPIPAYSYTRTLEQKPINSYEIDNSILTAFLKTDHEIPQNQDDYQIFVHDTRLQEVDIVIKSQHEVEIVCELPIDFEQNRLKSYTGFDDNGKFTVIVTDVDIADNA